MSGGVDSSVCAHLLLEQGYEVCGLTLGLDPSGSASQPTPEAEAARALCEQLGIPHLYQDHSPLFCREVVDGFCSGYLAGRTPNPCVTCNPAVKFAALEKVREEGGFDLIATGHYAKVKQNRSTGRWELWAADHKAKDQSYFLYGLSQQVLSRCLFPLGTWDKTQVKAIAERYGLPCSSQKESQDICFIPQGDYTGFIAERVGDAAAFQEGPIVNRAGERLGTHKGLVHYTCGQRKGIGVAGPEPYYVLGKDTEENSLVIGTADEATLKGLVVGSLNHMAEPAFDEPRRLSVKTHYRQEPRMATVASHDKGRMTVTFDEPQPLSAPGQSAVCYDGDKVVCGGVIESIAFE